MLMCSPAAGDGAEDADGDGDEAGDGDGLAAC